MSRIAAFPVLAATLSISALGCTDAESTNSPGKTYEIKAGALLLAASD